MEVHLAIYDLSGGMARSLSAQFLGPNHTIDMIPHTALLVFGKEYFYGGGIQAVDPHVFRSTRGIQPCQIQVLGTTRVTQQQFEAWCSTTGSAKFHAYSYDLLQRNCNNFTHEAAIEGLKLSQGIPDWILHVPQRFLSSPMGMMVRPMLEQMQITQTAPVQASSELSFNNQAPSTSTPASSVNPWENMGKAKSTPSPVSDSKPLPTKPTSASVLDQFTKPMLSNDSQSIVLCIKKLSTKLDDDEKKELNQVADNLKGKTILVNEEIVKKVMTKLLQIAKEDTGSLSYVLLLVRLVALKYSKYAQECIEWIKTKLISNGDVHSLNPISRSLAWCVVSNYCSVVGTTGMDGLVDSALGDWHHDSVQVRQAASTYLYNYILSKPKDSQDGDDVMVSILCSSLENVTTEKDPTTQLRQLVICGRLVFPLHQDANEVAKALVHDLGFVDMLQEVVRQSDASSSDASSDDTTKQCHNLATELANKLSK